MSLSSSSYLSLFVSLSLSLQGHHWIVRVMSFPNLYFMWVVLLKSLECGCLSTIGFSGMKEMMKKTTVRSVPDGSDNDNQKKNGEVLEIRVEFVLEQCDASYTG